ncbi:MAG: hypothetical protein CMF41_05495 [Legionellales bacterium]|nr:hypothetical protein [Legionellales bacterium]OUX64507.1 MAG: hypothetical protein CBE41_03110 [Gammaproteobacteria bacterium TMED281]
MTVYCVFSLYQFVTVHDVQGIKKQLEKWREHSDLKGTLICASEGINGTIAAFPETIDQFEKWLAQNTPFTRLESKKHTSPKNPFLRFKVKEKKEIVTMNQENARPDQTVGTYVDPNNWNHLLEDDETVVLDTRNEYEVAIGSFKGSIDPKTNSFREFSEYVKTHLDPKKHKKVAMFCTGGIRCEKASSWMLNEGFEAVYHLKGGILNYLKQVDPNQSQWEGDCFVFDQRVAVDHAGMPSGHLQCFACRMPLTKEQSEHPAYEPGVSCEFCADHTTDTQKASFRQRQLQQTLAKKRGKQHIGAQK